MSAIAALTLQDGLATPVTHTFNPLSHSTSEFMWREIGVSSTLGAAVVTLAFLPVKGNAALEKIRVKVMLPALETATGNNADGYTAAPKLAYSLSSIQDFLMPKRATQQQRKDITAYAKNILYNAQVYDALYDGVRPY